MRREFIIESLGQHGDGRSEGMFFPRTLPGETVSADITDQGPQDIRITTPSEHRVKPPCRHSKICGGCHLQHASDAFVAAWKQQTVTDLLAHIGLHPEMRPVITSPARSRRRAGFAARRTKSGAMAGFHARGSDALVDVQDCTLLAPALQKGLELARALAVAAGSRKSELSVFMTAGLDGLDVSVSGGKPFDDTLPPVLNDHPVARLTWDGALAYQRTAPRTQIAGLPVTIPPGAFLQATPQGETALQACVTEAIGPAQTIADLFSGCGTFALALAPGRNIHAVEAERDMLHALQAAVNAAATGLKITTETRNLFTEPLLPAELNTFDAVVLDPPRAGAAAQAQHLATSNVPRIAYVSCDPTSFARDARTLTDAGYTLHWVQVIDQFRWSPHIELAALFTRA